MSTESFKAILEKTQRVEGMTTPFSIAVIDVLLSFQKKQKIAGHILEFGVYKGKSAILLREHLGINESLVLVDIEKYIDDSTLQLLGPETKFILGASKDLKNSAINFESLIKKIRFLHIDSSHAYRTTIDELRLTESLLSPDGILCMDDFTNLNYSQILPALYKYLYTEKTDLTVFLVTNEKAYLCRRAYFDLYANYVLREIVAEVSQSANQPMAIARTDMDIEYAAFYLRPKLEYEPSEFYGNNIYGDMYINASPRDMLFAIPRKFKWRLFSS